MVSPKNVKTLFLKTRAKTTISDSLICRVVLSCCHNHLSEQDNLFAISTVKQAISLLLVNIRKTGAEYWGLDTSRFKKISASRISKVLSRKISGGTEELTSSVSISDTTIFKISARKLVLFGSLLPSRISKPGFPEDAKKANRVTALLRSFSSWKLEIDEIVHQVLFKCHERGALAPITSN